MAQLTVIRGRKMPSTWYRRGLNRSTNISTNCTNAAITAMNMMNCRCVRSAAHNGASATSTP